LSRRRRGRNGSSDFTGQVVVITGAGSGIGRATAMLFARLGAKVHVVDLDPGAADAVREEIERRGGQAVAHGVDCSDAAAVEALAERVFSEDPVVDVLHNNAGVGHAGAVDETTLEDWLRVLGVNLMGTVYCVHTFVPRLLRQGRPAHIVNTASGLGLVVAAEMAPYTTSKFAVVGLSEALNAELAPRGIHVTALCPGIINTPIVNTAILRGDAVDRAERGREFYRTRGATPDVVAEAVADAVRRKRLIQTVPRLHVDPAWILRRISPRAANLLARRMPQLLSGGR
jgi:NAD(P)-dependent dehydrogenase (short-subunit alcohol dehydrogenase family)